MRQININDINKINLNFTQHCSYPIGTISEFFKLISNQDLASSMLEGIHMKSKFLSDQKTILLDYLNLCSAEELQRIPLDWLVSLPAHPTVQVPMLHFLSLTHTNLSCFQKIISTGSKAINLNTKDLWGNNLLHYLIINPAIFPAVLNDLKSQEMQFAQPNNCSQTILHAQATLLNNGSHTKQLISLGIEPTVDSDHLLPLHYSIVAGNDDIVSFYLNYHNENDIRMKVDGINIMHLAAACNQSKVFNLLARSAKAPPLDERDGKNSTILHHAVLTGDIDNIQNILQQVPQLRDISNMNEVSPWHLAALLNHRNIIDHFLKNNSTKILNKHGENLLHHVSSRSLAGMIQYLIEEQKFDVNFEDHFGWTALSYAVWYQQADNIRLLLNNYKAEVKQDSYYQDLYDIAFGNKQIERLLVNLEIQPTRTSYQTGKIAITDPLVRRLCHSLSSKQIDAASLLQNMFSLASQNATLLKPLLDGASSLVDRFSGDINSFMTQRICGAYINDDQPWSRKLSRDFSLTLDAGDCPNKDTLINYTRGGQKLYLCTGHQGPVQYITEYGTKLFVANLGRLTDQMAKYIGENIIVPLIEHAEDHIVQYLGTAVAAGMIPYVFPQFVKYITQNAATIAQGATTAAQGATTAAQGATTMTWGLGKILAATVLYGGGAGLTTYLSYDYSLGTSEFIVDKLMGHHALKLTQGAISDAQKIASDTVAKFYSTHSHIWLYFVQSPARCNDHALNGNKEIGYKEEVKAIFDPTDDSTWYVCLPDNHRPNVQDLTFGDNMNLIWGILPVASAGIMYLVSKIQSNNFVTAGVTSVSMGLIASFLSAYHEAQSLGSNAELKASHYIQAHPELNLYLAQYPGQCAANDQAIQNFDANDHKFGFHVCELGGEALELYHTPH